MKKVSKKTIEFLKSNVKELDSFLPLNDDLRYELLEYIENLFVIPLANASGENQQINEDLLNSAEDVIDNLNIENFDFDDFNRRIK